MSLLSGHRRTGVRSGPMSDLSGAPRPPAADYGTRFQVAAVVIAVTGVMLLAVAAFLVSYAGLRQIAVAAGVSPALAGLYPLIVDAVLVVACVAALALRGAGWQLQGGAWLSVMVLFAVVAVAGAVHAAGVSLPHRPAAAAVAALPWGLFLLGFGLCLSVLRHLRAVRAAGPPGDRGAAPWWPWTADPHTADAAALPAQPEPASSGADPETADVPPPPSRSQPAPARSEEASILGSVSPGAR